MDTATKHKPSRRETRDYLAGVFESFPAALLSLDTRLRVIMMNGAAEELTGFRRSEIERRRVNAVMGVSQLRSITRILRKRARYQADGFITKIRSKEGGDIPVRLVVSPLRRGRGAFAGILCVISDLRDVKRLQGKLLEAERLAALSEIAVGLSHAINNPLCAMQTMYLDTAGKGGWTLLMGKGHDATTIDSISGRVLIAGHCAIEEVSDRLIRRLGRKNVYLSGECNDLSATAEALFHLMRVPSPPLLTIHDRLFEFSTGGSNCGTPDKGSFHILDSTL